MNASSLTEAMDKNLSGKTSTFHFCNLSAVIVTNFDQDHQNWHESMELNVVVIMQSFKDLR